MSERGAALGCIGLTRAGGTLMGLLPVLMAVQATPSLAQDSSCEIVRLSVQPEELAEIENMPDGTVFYMSQANRFESLAEVGAGEFGVWSTDMQYFLGVTVKFGRSTPWDGGQGIGGASWGTLFLDGPELKLFVTQDRYEGHSVICETGGGALIDFVAGG